ncbi:BLUF domain-containing protein [Winogradskyella sp. F6397]|uniref:BLUF domain-containing protein n=1 Tax=Winogradskyella marina TaxID=2785530 RepID=A0ABS0EJR7_9FLAO|nr:MULTISPECIES: BLUF domain-containing protein [Winogradskyella]MBF8150710.1 BLUF domain-containing protein [Winogradskyella marina]
MYQLNYHSKSIPGLTSKNLENILNEATSTNGERNITGCLIYHNESFVQILEGEKKDVLEVYNKIKEDKRHHSIMKLYENDVDRRSFIDWNMAYHKPDDQFIVQYVNNLLLLSKLSDNASNSLITFWGQVRRIIESGSLKQHASL